MIRAFFKIVFFPFRWLTKLVWGYIWSGLGGDIQSASDRAVVAERRAIPKSLQGSRVVINEKAIRTTKPVPLHGKPDQVLLTQDGVLVPIDTKTRNRAEVRDSDVIQLGVYAAILRNTRNQRVGDVGYVRVVKPCGTVRYLPVRLLSDQEIVMLHKERAAIKAKKTSKVRVKQSECHFCEYRLGCPKSIASNKFK